MARAPHYATGPVCAPVTRVSQELETDPKGVRVQPGPRLCQRRCPSSRGRARPGPGVPSPWPATQPARGATARLSLHPRDDMGVMMAPSRGPAEVCSLLTLRCRSHTGARSSLRSIGTEARANGLDLELWKVGTAGVQAMDGGVLGWVSLQNAGQTRSTAHFPSVCLPTPGGDPPHGLPAPQSHSLQKSPLLCAHPQTPAPMSPVPPPGPSPLHTQLMLYVAPRLFSIPTHTRSHL